MQLKDYIQGNRRGNEANRLEREAMNDPFLQEALDGFHNCEGNHAEIIDRLEKRFSTPAVVPHKNKKVFMYWSIAASVLLLIGFYTFFAWERNIMFDVPQIVLHESRTSESEAAFDSPQFEPTEEAEQEMSDAKATQKTMPAPVASPSIPVVRESRSLAETVVADADYVSVQPEAPLAMESSKEQKIMVQDEKQEKSTIQGKIVDENGDPLIGVSIVEKGTTNGTLTDVNGNFTLVPAGDSSKLIASYLGYEPQEISPSNKAQTVMLQPSNLALNDVVVVGYGTQKKSAMTEAVSSIRKSDTTQSPFGEKEFQSWCQQKVDKNNCEGKGATVKVSFFVDEMGKPSEIEYKNYSCEDAKKEIEKLLASSPAWTKTGRRVTMTIRW